jgi:hypothetical protein
MSSTRRLDAVRADDPTDDEPVGSAERRSAQPVDRPDVGLSPVRLAAVPEYRRRSRPRRGAASPRRSRTALLRTRHRALDRLQSAVVRARPEEWHGVTVAESVANLACVGATAKAVVNCLNFGNPEHPEVMWQLSESIDGMAWPATNSACRSLVATSRSTTRAGAAILTPPGGGPARGD